MSKYIFTYSISSWTKRNPSKRVPTGGAFCAEGARLVMKRLQNNGFRVSDIIIAMHYADKPLDWNNPISERKIVIHN